MVVVVVVMMILGFVRGDDDDDDSEVEGFGSEKIIVVFSHCLGSGFSMKN